MRLEPSAIFRKVIVPWYDSDGMCRGTMIFLFLVMLFALGGVFTACREPLFRAHAWVPLLLAAASGIALVRIALRLARRRRGKP